MVPHEREGVTAVVSTCGRCGAALTPGDAFCRACGTPAGPDPQHAAPRPDWRPPAQVLPAPMQPGPASRATPPRRPGRRSPRPALVAGAVLAVLAVGGAAAGTILRSADRTAATVPTFAPLPVPVSVPAPAPVPSSSPPSAPLSAAPATDAPADLLRRQLDADADRVESLVGKWIPQLSSKRADDDPAAVLADFRTWQERVPGSVLTRSERFTSFRSRDYWVTLAAQPFDTAEAANAWCDAAGLAPGDCFAKRLSHTEGPSGNTRPR